MSQYATSVEADTYFSTRLYSDVWDQASPTDKDKALIAATQSIDRLRFVGVRHSVWLVIEAGGDEAAQIAAIASQTLEFPRGSDVTVPSDIKIACYEEALSLLDEKDPDQELEDLAVVSQGYSSVRSTYDRSFTQEHLNAGIVSPRAWRFLKPYLRGGRDVKISRV